MRFIRKLQANTSDEHTVWQFHANKEELRLIQQCVNQLRLSLRGITTESSTSSRLNNIVKSIEKALADKSEPEGKLKDL